MRLRFGSIAAATLLAAPTHAAEGCTGPPRCERITTFGSGPSCSYVPADFFEPTYAYCVGPKVVVDTTHNNRHQTTPRSREQRGLYWGFAKLLFEDGYDVRDSDTEFSGPITMEALQAAHVRVLVVAGARDEVREPVSSEINRWVESGGRLFLILDHGWFAVTAREIVEGWGLSLPLLDVWDWGPTWQPDEGESATGPTFFRADQTLSSDSVVSNGSAPLTSIDEVTLETGTVLRAAGAQPAAAGVFDPVLIFPPGAVAQGGPLSVPGDGTRWENSDIGGTWQGVGFTLGAGRVYVSGSSGNHTALESPGSAKGGMHAVDDDHQTEQYLLNIVHWLDAVNDRDDDGVPDHRDNCPDAANGASGGNQVDADSDGIGNACDGDFDQDGRVSARDLRVVLLPCIRRGAPGPREDPSCDESDMDGDGTVTSADLVLWSETFEGRVRGSAHTRGQPERKGAKAQAAGRGSRDARP